jgi:hypothetical protein
MDESLDSLYSIAKKKHKICPVTYSYYLLASITLTVAYFIVRYSSSDYSLILIPLGWILALYWVILGFKSQREFNFELALTASKEAHNILDLRPFCITNKLIVKNPQPPLPSLLSSIFPFYLPTDFLPENINWESILAKSIEELAPLIGLGFPSEATGANLIEVKKWKKSVLALMEQAELIFVVPSSHAGTKWEIDMLRKGNYLSKCLFILPEGMDPFRFTISQSWLTLKNSMEQIGIEIPEYNKKGIAFKLNEDGTLKEKISPFSVSQRCSIFSFLTLRKYPNPQEKIIELFSHVKRLYKPEYPDTESELEDFTYGTSDENRDCRVDNHKQINNIIINQDDKKKQWLRKLEYFEKNGYLDEYKEEEASFEEQVAIKFIEAVHFDKAIIQFTDKELDTKIFEDSIKFFILIKTIGNDVYIEIYQQNSEGLNIRRCVKFMVSGILIVNIKILEEEHINVD